MGLVSPIYDTAPPSSKDLRVAGRGSKRGRALRSRRRRNDWPEIIPTVVAPDLSPSWNRRMRKCMLTMHASHPSWSYGFVECRARDWVVRQIARAMEPARNK